MNFTVDWDDGTVETIEQLNHHLRQVIHTYAKPGIYTVAINFNGNISQRDLSGVRNISNLFSDLQLPPEHYDDLLNAWSKLPPPRLLDFTFLPATAVTAKPAGSLDKS